jgi:hypothetical protein
MNVSAQARIISEVVAGVIRVFIDHDLVTIPIPIIDEAVVVGRHAEIEAIEPEAVASAAAETENVARPEAAGESAMFPGAVPVDLEACIVAVVSDPLIVGVHVRSVGVAGAVVESALILVTLILTALILVTLILTARLILIAASVFGPGLFLGPGLGLRAGLLLRSGLLLLACGLGSASRDVSAAELTASTAAAFLAALLALRGNDDTG